MDLSELLTGHGDPSDKRSGSSGSDLCPLFQKARKALPFLHQDHALAVPTRVHQDVLGGIPAPRDQLLRIALLAGVLLVDDPPYGLVPLDRQQSNVFPTLPEQRCLHVIWARTRLKALRKETLI